jgi:hypothetical protein
LKTASALLAILAALTTAAATLQPQPRALAIPPQMIIDDLRESYSLLFAEEVEVRYRAPQAPVRTDSFTVRIDPGDDPDHRPARLRLDLGPLRILFADGQMTAVSQAAPEVYFRQHYQGPITPALLARVLPPLPLPQLALAALHGDAFSSPTVYTPDIHWVSGTLEADGRPAIMTMIGSGPSGNVEVTANAETARLTRMVLQIRSAGSEAPMVLTMRAIEPGDPETWSIDIGARRAVDSLSELRPSARPGPLAPGREVPDLGFTAPDNTRWSLYSALRAAQATAPPGRTPAPFALLLVRIPAEQDLVKPRLQEAAAALDIVRAHQQSGRIFDVAVAGLTQLGEFNPDRFAAARAA